MIQEESIFAEKKRLRDEMKNLLADTDPSRFLCSGSTIASLLSELTEWRASATVCAFISMRREIDTEKICLSALGAGKTLCLPRTEKDDLSFRVCSDLAGPWDEGVFGIREPLVSSPVADFSRLTGPILVVVPGLAFDSQGRRLGRGKGYYDRFLRALRSLRGDSYAVGIALDFQLKGSVPVTVSDEQMDLVLTD